MLGKVVPTLGTLALDPKSVSRDPKVVEAYENDPLNYHGKVKAGTGAALLTRLQTFPARLPSLTLPLLVMHGEKDKLTNPEGSKLVDELAGSTDKTLTIYPGCSTRSSTSPSRTRSSPTSRPGSRSTWCEGLAALPDRRALLGERRRALLGVLGAEHRQHQL